MGQGRAGRGRVTLYWLRCSFCRGGKGTSSRSGKSSHTRSGSSHKTLTRHLHSLPLLGVLSLLHLLLALLLSALSRGIHSGGLLVNRHLREAGQQGGQEQQWGRGGDGRGRQGLRMVSVAAMRAGCQEAAAV